MTEHGARSAPPRQPFALYDGQQRLIHVVREALHAGVDPCVAIELPTGCGKTYAALSAVLQFQQSLRGLTPPQLATYFAERRLRREALRAATMPAATSIRTGTRNDDTSDQDDGDHGDDGDHSDDDDDDSLAAPAGRGKRGASLWTIPPAFFEACRGDAGTALARRRTARFVEAQQQQVARSSKLRREHPMPPVTIFYVSRTHAQLEQAVNELRRLTEGPGGGDSRHGTNLRMNVLASRDRYCINPRVRQSLHSGALPSEGNNLGEVCDKLVAVDQCPSWRGFGDLADRVLRSGLSSSAGRNCKANHQSGGRAWNIEDLVAEGAATDGCPYYASREMVFHADIVFCTFQYLLDPLIRKETRFERALDNHSIVIFDEAHNVADVCQDGMSSVFGLDELRRLVDEELAPLTSHGIVYRSQSRGGGSPLTAPESATTTAFVQQYPRSFNLGKWTVQQVVDFLYELFDRAARLIACPGAGVASASVSTDAPEPGRPKTAVRRLDPRLFLAFLAGSHSRRDFFTKFRSAFAVIYSLGVTFNPFNLSVVAVAQMKTFLMLLRFLLPAAPGFALWVGQGERTNRPALFIRSLDPSVGFQHLAKKTWMTIMMSGTLAPFRALDAMVGGSLRTQPLAVRLPNRRVTPAARNNAPQRCRKRGREAHSAGDNDVDAGTTLVELPTTAYEGTHVADVRTQCVVGVLTTLQPEGNDPRPPLALHCTHTNYQDESFVARLAAAITHAAVASSCAGGVLVFAPNSWICCALHRAVVSQLQPPHFHHASSTACFLEPRTQQEFSVVLDDYRSACRRVALAAAAHSRTPNASVGGCVIMVCVFRGRSSEGINFTDEMARMVISVGIPFQPLLSESVQRQREFSGEAWYRADAIRAVNQALGRCIRHRGDFGALFLFDARFAAAAAAQGTNQQRCQHPSSGSSPPPSFQGLLSKWIREAVREYDSCADLTATARAFFATRRAADVSWALLPRIDPLRCTAAAAAASTENVAPELAPEILAGFSASKSNAIDEAPEAARHSLYRPVAAPCSSRSVLQPESSSVLRQGRPQSSLFTQSLSLRSLSLLSAASATSTMSSLTIANVAAAECSDRVARWAANIPPVSSVVLEPSASPFCCSEIGGVDASVASARLAVDVGIEETGATVQQLNATGACLATALPSRSNVDHFALVVARKLWAEETLSGSRCACASVDDTLSSPCHADDERFGELLCGLEAHLAAADDGGAHAPLEEWIDAD